MGDIEGRREPLRLERVGAAPVGLAI